MKKRVTFPKKLVKGNCKVTVYRNKHKNTAKGFIYQVAWHDTAGLRRIKQFTDQDSALQDAKRRLEQIVAGEVEAAGMARADITELREARKIVGDTDLITALKEWKEAQKYAPNRLVDAAKEWQIQQGKVDDSKTVSFIYDAFLKAKVKSGRQPKTYTAHLDAFNERFGAMPIAEIEEATLQNWLDTFENHSTRNTKRKRLVTMFRWAQRKRYLPASIKTAAELTDTADEEEKDIESIPSPTLFALLEYMKKEHPHYVAPLVLAGLCGLRRTEVQKQKWDDIKLERKLLFVSGAKKNTPARRIVRLSEKAINWLSFAAQPAGEVCPGDTWAMDRIRDIGQTNDRFKLPPNCFRNGYISHLVALSGNIERTSLEAGNTPQIIRKHYLELFTAEEGAEWFGDFPEMTGTTAKQKVG